MAIFSNTWKTITGKVSDTFGMYSRSWRNQLSVESSIDYSRNDYELYRSLYYTASINKKAQDMMIGGMFARPIINSTTAFAVGSGITAGLSLEMDEEQKQKIESSINEWLEENASVVGNFAKAGFRDGDSYLYVDEFGNITELDADTVEVVLDPVSGVVVGYDVIEYINERDEWGQETKWVIYKQYRYNSTRYTKYPAREFTATSKTNGEVIFDRVFTVDGPVEPTEQQEFLAEDLVNRPLPVIHFANDRESRQVYGNSEVLSCLVAFRNYHAILSNATKGVINSAHPVPYVLGGKSPKNVKKQPLKDPNWDDDSEKIDWSPDNILFFDNPDAKVGYAQANGMMGDVGALLEFWFYLILENSETPEFVFGAAVKSSKASVSEQMPIVVQKAERKRKELNHPFKQLIELYIDRRIRLSNIDFLKLKNADYKIQINYPELVEDDKTLTLEMVKFLVSEGIMSDKTALEVLANKQVKDPQAELEEARKDSEARNEAVGASPAEPNRIQDELDADDDEE